MSEWGDINPEECPVCHQRHWGPPCEENGGSKDE